MSERDDHRDNRDIERNQRDDDRDRDYYDYLDQRNGDPPSGRPLPKRGILWAKPAFLIPVGTGAVALVLWIVFGVLADARDTASNRSHSLNHVRQLSLSLHNFESAFGRLPPAIGGRPLAGAGVLIDNPMGKNAAFSTEFPRVYLPVHGFLLPYHQNEPLFKSMAREGTGGEDYLPTVGNPGYRSAQRYYYSFADPSIEKGLAQNLSISRPNHDLAPAAVGGPSGATSYAANFQLFGKLNKGETAVVSFDRGATIASISDGSSNTIAFIEKFGACTAAARIEDAVTNQGIPVQPTGSGGSLWAEPNLNENSPFVGYPQGGNNTYTRGAGVKFQVRPKPDACNPFQPSTQYARGIFVGMLDGSGRVVSPKVSSETLYRAFCPDDDMPLGADW